MKKKMLEGNMRFIIKIFFLALVLLSCNDNTSKVERQKVHLELIYADIEIQFPGQLVVGNNCLLLFDPLASSKSVKILDKQTGNIINEFIDVGSGPAEFVTPWCGYSTDDTLTIIDLNGQKKAEFNVDNLCKGEIHINPVFFPHNNAVQLSRVGTNKYVAGIFEGKEPFSFIENNEVVYDFGKYPINEKIDNAFNAFQGTVLYNEDRNLVGYATFSTPYIALYKFDDDNFNLLWESEFATMHYNISDNQLNWQNRQPAGIHEFSFAKDYIVCLVKEMELRNSLGRSEEHMAKAIYLYNYDGMLVKILDIDYPSIRIASKPSDNDIYLISLNEEYCLTRFKIEK